MSAGEEEFRLWIRESVAPLGKADMYEQRYAETLIAT